MTEKRIVNLSSTVVRSDTVIASEIDGEVVMMNIEHGSYSWLDAIGSEIWNMLKSPRRISEICEILMENYDVERKSCEEDVLAFLNALDSKNIITVEGCTE